MSKPRIRKLVMGVNMGLGHGGLRKLLAKENINVDTLTGGDLVLCLNGFGDKLKVVGCRGLVLGYLKMPHRQRIMREALQYIPQTFGGSSFDYVEACKRALDQRLGSYPHKPRGPLNEARARAQAGL